LAYICRAWPIIGSAVKVLIQKTDNKISAENQL